VKLTEARRLAERLREAEDRFDATWRTQRNAGCALGGIVGLIPLLVLLRAAGEEQAFLALPIMALWLGALWLLQETARRRIKRRYGAATMDAAVLAACADLPDLPAALTDPLEQALDAYRAMSRSADDPAWKANGFDARHAADRAGEHLLSLFGWARQLAGAADSVARLRATGGGPELEAALERQIGDFRRAAAAFQAADVRMAHAHLALAGAQGRGTASQDALRDLNASFDAIAEVAHGPYDLRAAPTEPAVQHLGTPTGSS